MVNFLKLEHIGQIKCADVAFGDYRVCISTHFHA